MATERTPVPEDLDNESKKRLVGWVKERFPHLYNPRDMRTLVDSCLAWHGARDNPHGIVNWYRACQNWIIKDQEFKERDRPRRTYRETEYPQESRETGYESSDLVPIGNVIDLFHKKVAK